MPELHFLLGHTRKLTGTFQEGGFKSFAAFHEFISFLLRLTVIRRTAFLKLYSSKKEPAFAVIGGASSDDSALPLNNGAYLRVMFRLQCDSKDEKLSVTESTFQYQLEPEKTSRWIFRYDYLRKPPHHYPASHLQVNGKILESSAIPLICPDIHFPVNRISLEAVIRLLVEQFKVKCNEPKHWRKVLAESERLFYDTAFRPLSGPEE